MGSGTKRRRVDGSVRPLRRWLGAVRVRLRRCPGRYSAAHGSGNGAHQRLAAPTGRSTRRHGSHTVPGGSTKSDRCLVCFRQCLGPRSVSAATLLRSPALRLKRCSSSVSLTARAYPVPGRWLELGASNCANDDAAIAMAPMPARYDTHLLAVRAVMDRSLLRARRIVRGGPTNVPVQIA